MATIPRRLHVVSPAQEAAINLPERVTIALGELAGAVKQGLLAHSVGVGLAVVAEIFDAEVTEWSARVAGTIAGGKPIDTAKSLGS